MKYIKKSMNLINSYPIILLALIPNLIITILSKLSDNTSAISIFASLIIPLLAIVISLFVRIFVTKITFTVRNNSEQDYDIDMKQAYKRGIPRLLLNSFTAFLVYYALSFALLSSIAIDVLGFIYSMDIANALGSIFTVLLGIDGIGKVIILLIGAVFVTIYVSVFLIFVNTNLTINSMMKASFKYTYKNFKKLFVIFLLLIIIPISLLFGSVLIFNLVNGLSFASLIFMQSWAFVALQFIVSICSVLFYTSIVLTWNDEENKSIYLKLDKQAKTKKPAAAK